MRNLSARTCPRSHLVTFKDVTEQVEPQDRSFVTESPRMRQVLAFVRKVASSEASSILIEGESGTGKDLIAKMFHYQSMRQAVLSKNSTGPQPRRGRWFAILAVAGLPSPGMSTLHPWQFVIVVIAGLAHRSNYWTGRGPSGSLPPFSRS